MSNIKPELSVIVAIYGVELYIDKCIKSILNQTYKNFELILVDDGSKDKCGIICDTYAEKDTRIIVIHKENEGLIYARRDGLRLAIGNYVIMMDGDDWIDENYFDAMIRCIKKSNADVVIDSYLTSYPEYEKIQKMTLECGVYTDTKLDGLKKHAIYCGKYFDFGFSPAVWNKIFLRERLKQYYDHVPKDVTLGEDFIVTMPYVLDSECVTITDTDTFYHYVQRADSMVKSYNSNLVEKVKTLKQYTDEWDYCGYNVKEQLRYYYAHIYFDLLRNQFKSPGRSREKIEAIRQIESIHGIHECLKDLSGIPLKYKIVLWLAMAKKYRLLYAVCKIFVK